MIRYLLLLALLAIVSTNAFTQGNLSYSEKHSINTDSQFARYNHSDTGYDYYWVRLSNFHSEFERYYFYALGYDNGIHISDKSTYDADSALFQIKSGSTYNSVLKLNELYSFTLKTSESMDDGSKQLFLNDSPFFKIKQFNLNESGPVDGPFDDLACSSAQVSCSGNTYSFPAGTTGSATSVNGYPNYDCLSTTPCPAWYYMQVGVAGDINIHITQITPGFPPTPRDVDFICWGPFTSLTQGCAVGLTGGSVVDCSYSPNNEEDCFIPNAQVGEIYILLMTNFSQQAATITFLQDGGVGETNCDIVLNCGIIALTANSTACSPSTNKYNVTGNVEFTNPPATGLLTITDITAVPPVSQVINVTPTFTSPQAYALNNITCDGAVHTITATFSAEPTCSKTTTISAPPNACPIGSINGGGIICNDGASTTPVLIDLIGAAPFNFTYAINGIPQTPVNNYSGVIPYVINASAPGSYTLVSLSNAACSGTVSGTATVVQNPRPVPTITGPATLCIGSNNVSYSSPEPSNHNYTWTITGGTIIGGQGSSTVTVNWTVSGAQQLTVTCQGPAPTNCTPVAPAVYNVNVIPVPVVNAGSDPTICQGQSITLTGATVSNESSFGWSKVTGSGSLTDAATYTPTYTPTPAETGDVVLSLSANGLSTCSAVSDQVTIHILPMVTADAGPDKSVCQNSTFTVTSASSLNHKTLLWTTSGTGILSGETTITPSYVPGAGETGPVTFTLTAAGNPPCGNVVDDFILTVNPPVTANAGPPDVICETGTFALSASSTTNEVSWLWTTSGSGSFDNATILHPIYTPLGADITSGNVTLTLTAAGLPACPAATSNVLLSISRQVVLSAGPDGSVCQNASFPVTGASEQFSSTILWTSNGTGTITNANTIAPTYNPGPGESGVVTLTLTGSPILPCSQVTDQMDITIHPLPTANAGLSGISCQGANYLVVGATAGFQSSVAWTEDGPGTLSGANTLTPTYIPLPNETGTVTLTLTAHGSNTCSAEIAVSTRTLTIHALPNVSAGADATICAATTLPVSGGESFTSSVLWTSSGDGSFAVPGSLSTVYTPGSNDILTGTVLLTFTGAGSGACALESDADQLSLIIDPMPAINAGPDGAFCVQAPIALTGTSATHYSTLQWTTSGDGGFSNNTIQAPTYNPGNIDFNNGTVTLTMRAFGQLMCATESTVDTRVLTVSAYPVINAGPDDYICSNVTSYQLNGFGNNYNTANIQWLPAGGDGWLSNPAIINPVYNAGPIDLSTMNRNITFTLTVQGIGMCSNVFINDQVLLKIDPTPISNAGPDDETCGRNPYHLNASAQYQSLINWITSGDGTFSSTSILNPTYIPGPTDVGKTVVLTLDLSGCQSLTGDDFLWLTVHPDPGATITGTTSICEGTSTPVSISLTGTAPWNITYTNGVGPVTVSNILSSPYTFNVNPSVSTNWWITAASDAFCVSPADSLKGLVSVTVFPLPDKFTTSVTDNGVFCEGSPGVIVGLNGSQTGMNYELFSNGLNSGIVRPGTGNPLNFGIVNVPGQYTIRGINPAGNCEAYMNDTVNVIMNPIPVTDFTSTTPCYGDTTQFTVSGQYISSTSYWQWNFGDGAVETFLAPTNPKHIYPAPGFYTVSLVVGDTNNCSYSVTHPVEVRAHPVAFFSFDTPNCLGTAVSFTDLSNNSGLPGYLNQWVWDFGDGTPPVIVDFPASPNIFHNYLSDGTYQVTLSVMNSRNCGDTHSTQITVTKRPVGDFLFTTGCQQETTDFTDISDHNGGGQIVTWQWNFGDPGSGALNESGQQNPVHSYTNSGIYQVSLIVTNLNGCKDTIHKAVNVKTRPPASFFSSPGCLNSPTLFLADSLIINIGATATYHWDFGDGGSSANRNTTHNYLSPGTYNVVLTITDTAGCAGDTLIPVTVNPPPTAHFSASADNCQGQAVAFTNQSTTLTGFITKWEWNFGDGNTQTILFPSSPSTTHTYAGTGTFNVTLTVTNSEGCQHSESRLINSLGAPASDFMAAGQCKDSPVSFTDLSTVTGTQSISAWHWDFGDPTSGVLNTSTLQNPVHTYAGTGAFVVELITFTGNNCSDTLTKTITIKPVPVVDFNTQSACAGNPALFIPVGMNAAAIATWNWNFGDGGTSASQSPSYTYGASGTYSVVLTVSDTAGCSSTRTKTIVIAPLPSANFGYTTPSCQGDAVSFTDMSSTASGFLARWDWDFGDGNTQSVTFPAVPDVTHLYANDGTFNVTLTVKTNDSCTHFLTRVVTVLPKPSAAFLHGAACQGSSVAFTDQSISNTTGGISEWAWNFGDPTSGTENTSGLQHPAHSYNLAGTYTVTLIVSIPGGCSDTTTLSVAVSPPPVVGFTQVAGCNGDTTQFTSSASVNMAATQGWYWQFGDGATSFLADPMHIYATAGTFMVTLTITDTAGCTNSKTLPVTVIPGPLAAFSSSTPGCSGLPITFTDLSNANGGSLAAWFWDFGDGTDTTYNAAVASFEHTYTQPGTFLVTLKVVSALGCENSKLQTIVMSPSPIAAFTFANTCQGQSTQFTDASNLNGGSSLALRDWDFGDPASGTQNSSALANPTHTFTQPGTYTVTLFTLNGGGCSDTVQQNVTITQKPTVDFYNDSLVCLGSTTTLFADTVATPIGAIQYYEWDFGDGSPHAFTQNVTHTYPVAGTFIVSLTVQDTAGCSNVKTHPLTIHPQPAALFSYAGICQNAPTLFTDLSIPPAGDTIVGWYWEFSRAGTVLGTDTLQNPEFTFSIPATYSVQLTAFTENGCSHTKTLPVQIWNTPTAYFKYTTSPCANGLVQFQDSSFSYQGTVNSWQWEFEPFQYGTGKNPSHLYYAVDSCYDVKLVIEDLRGCVDTLVQEVCVPPELTVDFTTSLTCFGSPVLFTSELLTPQAPADSLISFSWNFGDPATGTHNVSQQRHPTHAFSSVGFYTVNFTTTDKFGCQATAYQTVQVNALPMAGFSYTSGQCDSTLLFSSTSIDTSSTLNTFIWNYGDGSAPDTTLVPNSTHKYNTAGIYTTTLTVVNANGCTDTYSDTVHRSACLEAAYLSAGDTLCQNYSLSFTDMSTCDGVITQWDWDFGDGTPATVYTSYQPVVNHTFADAGIYTIRLKVSTLVGTSTLSDSTKTDVAIRPTPLTGFTVDPVCLGYKAEFADTTHANGSLALFYHWEFGDVSRADTSVLRNPDYLYTMPGQYTSQLVVKNQFGCADTATAVVTVNGLPEASYANSLACAGQQTFFFDASQEFAAPVITWGWRVKDSLGMIGSMQGATPAFIFDSTGQYYVRLMVADTNGCTDTIVQQVKVNAAPVSAFSYTENVENIQGQIQFTNGSMGAVEYFWDFGNGVTSYAESPLITYAQDGTYPVMLVAVSEFGCHDTTLISYDMMFKGLYVPNAFAPGGPIQATRYWKPVGVNLATYDARVYNSHGMLIWSSTALDDNGAPAESWDGMFKGSLCQQDVYVWMISAVFRDGSIWYNTDIGEHEGLSVEKWGTISLIR